MGEGLGQRLHEIALRLFGLDHLVDRPRVVNRYLIGGIERDAEPVRLVLVPVLQGDPLVGFRFDLAQQRAEQGLFRVRLDPVDRAVKPVVSRVVPAHLTAVVALPDRIGQRAVHSAQGGELGQGFGRLGGFGGGFRGLGDDDPREGPAPRDLGRAPAVAHIGGEADRPLRARIRTGRKLGEHVAERFLEVFPFVDPGLEAQPGRGGFERMGEHAVFEEIGGVMAVAAGLVRLGDIGPRDPPEGKGAAGQDGGRDHEQIEEGHGALRMDAGNSFSGDGG